MPDPEPIPPGPSAPPPPSLGHQPQSRRQGQQSRRGTPRNPNQDHNGSSRPVVEHTAGSDSANRANEANTNQRGRGRGRPRPPRRADAPESGSQSVDASVTGLSPVTSAPPKRQRPPRNRQRPSVDANAAVNLSNGSEIKGGPNPSAQPAQSSRRRQFGSTLTSTAATAAETDPSQTPQDLASRLTAAFSRSASVDDAPDCPICFSTITPGAPTWSCTSNVSSSSDPIHAEHGASSCCWTSFHLKCIKAWASKSTDETRAAYVARGLSDRLGEWRCPGCQTRRSVVPSEYRCFCGRTVDPRPGRLATPHSCGEGCSRSRDKCNHACPLPCHPGPCPPCILTVTQACHCGRETISARCSTLTSSNTTLEPLSCGQICDRQLGCGNHRCQRACHSGLCGECEVVVDNTCFCGKNQKNMPCGLGEAKACAVDGRNWQGRWECDEICDRPFDCGVHRCQKSCHPPSTTPGICPFSPEIVTTCPCSNKTPLSSLSAPPRASCSTPVPTCGKICLKPLPSCGHLCQQPCHTGPCASCSTKVDERCRCGRLSRAQTCSEISAARERALRGEIYDEDERDPLTGSFLCKKKCEASRNCGRHVCNRVCCPLAALAGLGDPKGKRRQRDAPTPAELAELDPEGWHTCDLLCNKRLPCGNHNCMERDHRGPCPPCLQSSYEELVCHCGQTVLDPPIPCGTVIRCSYPCSRPRLPCGHPKAPHTCHEDPIPCPPCPYLSEKTCACGKSLMQNVRCSQREVGCGLKCGKLLDCGFHACDKLCHSGDCGSCNQVCGKPRKSCLPAQHPCTKSCHAPSTCPEAEPCQARITLQCACGRLKQPGICGKSASNASNPGRVLPCMQECQIAKRNERLAAALGITPGEDGKASGLAHMETKYPEVLQSFWKANSSFATSVEKSLNDFVTSDKRLVVLNPMPLPRRKFVRDLAQVYGMDAEDVDQEPRRSVQLRRRVDTRIPRTLLSAVVKPPAPPAIASGVKKPTAAVNSPWGGSAVKLAWGQRPTVVGSRPSSTAPPVVDPWSSSSAPVVGPSKSHTPEISRGSTPVRNTNPASTEDVPGNWDEDA